MCRPTKTDWVPCNCCGSIVCVGHACLLAQRLAALVPEDGWEAVRFGDECCPHDFIADLAFDFDGTPILSRGCSCGWTDDVGAAFVPAVVLALGAAAA